MTFDANNTIDTRVKQAIQTHSKSEIHHRFVHWGPTIQEKAKLIQKNRSLRLTVVLTVSLSTMSQMTELVKLSTRQKHHLIEWKFCARPTVGTNY